MPTGWYRKSVSKLAYLVYTSVYVCIMYTLTLYYPIPCI